MKKINKGLLISAGAGLSALLPLFSVSCGEKNKNDEPRTGYNKYANDAFISQKLPFTPATNDSKVKVGVTFSRGKPQWNALEEVIKVYNEQGQAKLDELKVLEAKPEADLTDEEKAKKETLTKFKNNFLKVELVSAGTGGYTSGLDGLRTKIEAGNTNEIFNLTFNYPTLASMLARKGMLLNLNDKDQTIGLDLSNYDRRFTEDNSNISNVINKGTWTIPVSKSTIVTSVNGPVLAYVLETMEQNGATIDLPNYQAIKDSGTGDHDAVVSLWGNPIASADIRRILGASYKVDSSTFAIGHKLFDFANKAQKIFTKSKDRETSVHALGIDDSAGIIETLAYSAIDADPSKMITKSITRKKDGVLNRVADFTPFQNDESEVGKKMSEIYDELKTGVGNKAIVIQGNGQYTSVDSVKHKYIFGIGSTAGYKHNFTDPKDLGWTFKYLPASKNGNWDHAFEFPDDTVLHSVFVKEGKNALSFKDGRHTNNFELSTSTNNSKYNYFSLSTDVDTKINDLVAKVKAANVNSAGELADGYFSLMLSKQNNKKEIAALHAYAQAHSDQLVELGEFTKGKKDAPVNEDDKTVIFVAIQALQTVNADAFKLVKATEKDSLQENELFAFPAPTKWTADDEQNIVYLQGPSLIGISTDDRSDRGTKAFAHFLVQGSAISGKLDNKTPLQYFSEKASYISLSNGFQDADTSNLKNKFLKIAVDQFKQVAKDTNGTWNTYSEVPDEKSDKFREAFKTAFINMANQVNNSENGQTAGTYKSEIIDKVVSAEGTLFAS